MPFWLRITFCELFWCATNVICYLGILLQSGIWYLGIWNGTFADSVYIFVEEIFALFLLFFLDSLQYFFDVHCSEKSHFFDFLFNLVKVLPLSWSQLNSNQTGLVLNVFILELLNTMWLFLERRCINSFKLIIGVDCKPIWAIVKI